MTVYEHMDLVYSGFSMATVMVSLLVAVLSGYLVIAYVIGPNLTHLQVSVLNVTYSIWTLYLILSGTVMLVRARDHLISASELDQQIFAPVAYMTHGYVSIALFLWLTSLWFMWDVRHQKPD